MVGSPFWDNIKESEILGQRFESSVNQLIISLFFFRFSDTLLFSSLPRLWWIDFARRTSKRLSWSLRTLLLAIGVFNTLFSLSFVSCIFDFTFWFSVLSWLRFRVFWALQWLYLRLIINILTLCLLELLLFNRSSIDHLLGLNFTAIRRNCRLKRHFICSSFSPIRSLLRNSFSSPSERLCFIDWMTARYNTPMINKRSQSVS